jgi:acyl-CoA synthetase (AMP-forming)/AMP-acid ligase II
MLLHDFLKMSTERYPENEAVVHLARRMTFAELDILSDHIAVHLTTAGVRLGDRVILYIENSCDYVTAYFGALKAGAIVVPLNVAMVASEILVMIGDCLPAAVLTVKRRLPAVANIFQVFGKICPVIPVDDVSPEDFSEVGRSLPQISNNNLAAILYTSGTTGRPKGVMLTHENLCANALSIVGYLELNPADRVAAILPFYYSYGNSLITTHVMVGGTLVIDNRFMYPNTVLETMRREAVTGFAGVPSHFAILLHKSSLRNTLLPALRYVTQAGGHLAPDMVREFRRILPQVKFYIMYGQTEASARLTYLHPEFLDSKPGSIGKAIPDVEIRVVDETVARIAPGQVGEIVAKGKNIMAGYWNDPEGTAQVLKDGWLHTGDLARTDEEGFLYIVDRKKDIIKTGGTRISPSEIEDIVRGMPGIHECAVVGIPDRILGEALKLFVVPDEKGVTQKEVLNFCRQHLSPFKIPKYIELVRALPYTPSGKIKRELLRRGMSAGKTADGCQVPEQEEGDPR